MTTGVFTGAGRRWTIQDDVVVRIADLEQSRAGFLDLIQHFDPITGFYQGTTGRLIDGSDYSNSAYARVASQTTDVVGQGNTLRTITEYQLSHSSHFSFREVTRDNGVNSRLHLQSRDGVKLVRKQSDHDTADVHNWIMKTVTYAAGSMRSIEVLTDDLILIEKDPGYLASSSYLSRLPSETRSDLGVSKTWSEVVITRDFDGELKRQKLIWDDGTEERKSFDKGVVTGRAIIDADDNIRPWDHFVDRLNDVTGVLETRFIFFDDGRRIVLSYDENGKLRAKNERDDSPGSSAYAWVERERIYDAEGRTVETMVTRQDGSVTRVGWEDGEVVFRSNSSPVDAAGSVFRQVAYQDGAQVEITTRRQDGVETVLLFENGEMSEKIVTDGGVAFDWASKHSVYAADGSGMVSFSLTYDDGSTLHRHYKDGVLSTQTQTNGLATDNPVVWADRTKQYDETGALVSASVSRTDGIVTHVTWEDGQKVSSRDVDIYDQFVWAERETTFVDGAIAAVTESYDDGVVTRTTFDGGAPVLRVTADVDDVEDWATKAWAWDTDGNLLSYIVAPDDGI